MTDLILHWLLLFGFWLLLSGMFDPFHLFWGVLCSGLVAFSSRQLQLFDLGGRQGLSRHLAAVPWHRAFTYSLWLLRQVAAANWQVVRVVLDPSLPIDPSMIHFRTSVKSDLGVTLFANSITLTPGTITVRTEDGEFLVHSLLSGEPVVVGLSQIQAKVLEALATIETDATEPV